MYSSAEADSVFQMTDRAVMNTYRRLPLAFARGEGAWLYDVTGRAYLDFISGLGVTALGHGHPRLQAAIRAAADTLLHTSNLYYIPPQAELAHRLTQVTGFDRVFFCNSGAEANEAAIKLARRYHATSGQPGRFEIITALNSFHGRTLAT
ncbi:MAG: aminotransferase class III-fold pyridoxal phosphate-dependent enzyme, partial [Clostridia bacterium]